MTNEIDQVSDYQAQAWAKIAEEQAAFLPHGQDNDSILKAAASGEAGDAKLFSNLFKDQLVYDHAQGCWFEFKDHFWSLCEIDEPFKRIESLIEIYSEAAKKEFFCKMTATRAGEEKEASQAENNEQIFLKKIARLQRRQHRINVLALAAAGEGSLGISGREWDDKPLLLPCSNGVVDLIEGAFQDGMPREFILKYCPVAWEGFDAKAPRFEAFVHEILGDDSEKAAFVKRLLGSFIAGKVYDAVFPVFWGPGRNGKSLLLETLAYVLGPLAAPVQAELLMQQKHPRSAAAPSPEIMALKGLRLAWASESGEGRRLDSGRLKLLTGADSLTGRGPYDRRMIVFRPTHSLILLTNYRPAGNPQDFALWSRILSICFPYSFVDNPIKGNERQRDPQLADELRREGPGILAWLVDGFYSWQEKGLAPPPSIQSETDEYRKTDDSIRHFIDEKCLEGKEYIARAEKLFESYEGFCEETGFKPKGKRVFYQRLKDQYIKDKDKNGKYYKGLCLKEANNLMGDGMTG